MPCTNGKRPPSQQDQPWTASCWASEERGLHSILSPFSFSPALPRRRVSSPHPSQGGGERGWARPDRQSAVLPLNGELYAAQLPRATPAAARGATAGGGAAAVTLQLQKPLLPSPHCRPERLPAAHKVALFPPWPGVSAIRTLGTQGSTEQRGTCPFALLQHAGEVD